ncbi:hypothetical protein JCM10512_4329 [Bacteroides reticulotermitis JCM 10512]|uniref:Uncharacterized protein n=1 Tax=Bacteroides reticulotermitis JCM 10512 TaxID=1445607 RepID=W4UZ62_9BACE|nr:hypothetical protein JCM10512_4329 [Bacteroides reticulotermitis JCM 10512]
MCGYKKKGCWLVRIWGREREAFESLTFELNANWGLKACLLHCFQFKSFVLQYFMPKTES